MIETNKNESMNVIIKYLYYLKIINYAISILIFNRNVISNLKINVIYCIMSETIKHIFPDISIQFIYFICTIKNIVYNKYIIVYKKQT